MNQPRTNTMRRGLTLVELMIALVITAIMGLAIGSMMTMVSSVTDRERSERASLLRAHAGQVRLRAYMDSALCVLQHDSDNQSAVIWLYDKNAPGSVNLTELRLVSIEGDELQVEWVKFPENWSALQTDAADLVVPAGSNFALAIAAQRALGYTRTTTLLGDVAEASWTFSGKSVPESSRARLSLTLETEGQTYQAMYAFGLKDHAQPD
ncbi:MAG: prepilin-type N-terminal cleavage/methylation domain-containing protein [Phycisphaerales bacterium]|nr:prepilin-type N-terminal cleavage/methylation domain-containing protein [Phycisphaerales bacterium]